MTPDFAQTEGLPRKNTGRQDATKEIQPRISRMTRIEETVLPSVKSVKSVLNFFGCVLPSWFFRGSPFSLGKIRCHTGFTPRRQAQRGENGIFN